MKAKIIVFEGTDCSGKQTQAELLVKSLKEEGKKVSMISYPIYSTPTGKVIGTCLLGNPEMCKEFLKSPHGFFEEKPENIDSLTASCYYAADRRYSLPLINKYLEESEYLILDRYTTSNMAHRGGMIDDKNDRLKMYKKIETLEYDILELPRPDKVIFLHMPFEAACKLKSNRKKELDINEQDESHLRKSEKTYLELSELYNFDYISCVDGERIRTVEEIHEDVKQIIKNSLI